MRRAEVAVLRAARRLSRGYGMRPLRTASRMGEHAGVWIVVGVVGSVLDRRRRAAWLRGLVSVVGAHGVAVVAKRLVPRRRPVVDGLPALTTVMSDRSFPSAHAASSVAAAVALPSTGPAPLIPALATTIVVSRVALGVHWPSDVVAGAAIGWLGGRRSRR